MPQCQEVSPNGAGMWKLKASLQMGGARVWNVVLSVCRVDINSIRSESSWLKLQCLDEKAELGSEGRSQGL